MDVHPTKNGIYRYWPIAISDVSLQTLPGSSTFRRCVAWTSPWTSSFSSPPRTIRRWSSARSRGDASWRPTWDIPTGCGLRSLQWIPWGKTLGGWNLKSPTSPRFGSIGDGTNGWGWYTVNWSTNCRRSGWIKMDWIYHRVLGIHN
jgi:hypothetical protein